MYLLLLIVTSLTGAAYAALCGETGIELHAARGMPIALQMTQLPNTDGGVYEHWCASICDDRSSQNLHSLAKTLCRCTEPDLLGMLSLL